MLKPSSMNLHWRQHHSGLPRTFEAKDISLIFAKLFLLLAFFFFFFFLWSSQWGNMPPKGLRSASKILCLHSRMNLLLWEYFHFLIPKKRLYISLQVDPQRKKRFMVLCLLPLYLFIIYCYDPKQFFGQSMKIVSAMLSRLHEDPLGMGACAGTHIWQIRNVE